MGFSGLPALGAGAGSLVSSLGVLELPGVIPWGFGAPRCHPLGFWSSLVSSLGFLSSLLLLQAV